MLHFAYELNFKRPECAKWDGRKKERTNSLKGDGKSDAAQSKAELDDRGRAIRCSPKQKNCRSQQAAGHRQQPGCEAVCKPSTEFLITFLRNTLLAEVLYLCQPINSGKHHTVLADLQRNAPVRCTCLQ